jgi:hypothetical protein
MKIYVPTADFYPHIMKVYAELFNDYWPNQEVVILGHDISLLPTLPDNFEIVSLGPQSTSWCDPLYKYFSSIEDEYFILTLEDHFISGPVDCGMIDTMKELMIRDCNISKAMLHSHLNLGTNTYCEGIHLLPQDRDYRMSIHPAIWRTDYFLKYAKLGYTLIDFEQTNNQEAKEDGTLIISKETNNKKEDHIVPIVNVYRSGIIDPDPEYGPLGKKTNKKVRKAVMRATSLI